MSRQQQLCKQPDVPRWCILISDPYEITNIFCGLHKDMMNISSCAFVSVIVVVISFLGSNIEINTFCIFSWINKHAM